MQKCILIKIKIKKNFFQKDFNCYKEKKIFWFVKNFFCTLNYFFLIFIQNKKIKK